MPVQSKASVHSSDSWGYQLVTDFRSRRSHYVSTARTAGSLIRSSGGQPPKRCSQRLGNLTVHREPGRPGIRGIPCLGPAAGSE